MSWEVVPGGRTGRRGAPRITVSKRGLLMLNIAAVALLGDVGAVQCVVDGGRWGLRPCAGDAAGARRLSEHDAGWRAVCHHGFVERCGLRPGQRFPVKLLDGVLVADGRT